MKKLELKHLAPYLPYGLKGYAVDIKLIDKITVNNIMLCLNEQDKVKPILRPLSDLTKEIVYNGERFNLSEQYWGLNSFEYYFKRIETFDKPLSYFNSECPYGVVNLLFKYHFDVFGLIEQDLAININTI